MNRILPFLSAALSGFIIVSSWATSIPAIFVLIGYVPLLLAEYFFSKSPSKISFLKIFMAACVCFFTANLVMIWWLLKLVSYWAFFLFLFNSLFASSIFLVFSVIKNKLGIIWGYFSWIVFTIVFEFINLNIDFSFPCMLNGIFIFGSGNIGLVQWYEYTGILGGSVWVLLCNILFFEVIKKYVETRNIKTIYKLLTFSLICVVVPIIISLVIYYHYEEKHDPIEVAIVQPNIDPFTEKFVKSSDEQLDTMLSLTRISITDSTNYVLFPETALDSNIWLNNITENYMILKIKDSLLQDFPQAKVITGVDMMQYYVVHNGVPPTSNAKKMTNDNKVYFDFFNAAIQIDVENSVQVYKKSKLVLGTEYIPFSQKFPQIQSWIINLGGSTQSRGRQEEPSVFVSKSGVVATIICYESLFGEYVSKFIQSGAQAIFIITNDGWWDGTPAPLNHFRFSQLRAIENRRSVVRCANTGISGFIDQKGDIIQATEWWKPISVKNSINKNNDITFYSKYGDYIGRICVMLSVIIFVVYLYTIFISKKRK